MAMTLKAARVNAGFKQKETAQRLNVSRETIGKWERGETMPNVKQAEKMCDIYHCSIDEIIFLPKA